jgi:hypothetical protein
MFKKIYDTWFTGMLVLLAAMGYVLYTFLLGLRLLRHER